MNYSKIPYKILEKSRANAVNFYKISKGLFTEEVKPGQIWSTHSSFQLPNGIKFETDESKLVVILFGEGKPSEKFDEVTVAPLSIHTSMASEYDFIIKQKSGHSPLTFDFMIEVWNETPALKGQLNKFICSLSDEATEILSQLYASRLQNTEIPEHLNRYTGIRFFTEDNFRQVFQEEELVSVQYLANAATACLAIDFSEQKIENTEAANWFKFEFKPVLGKLSDYLLNPANSSIAHAANKVDMEGESWLIVESKQNAKFIFELLNSPKKPYSIYLKVHSVAPDIIGRNCIVSLKTKDKLYRSSIILLEEKAKIEVGTDPHFHSEDVKFVEVEIEDT